MSNAIITMAVFGEVVQLTTPFGARLVAGDALADTVSSRATSPQR